MFGKEQNTQLEQEIYDNLDKTKQHLKYKNKLAVQSYINNAINFISLIFVLLIFFLPIFKIKTEFLGISLGSKNFSVYEAFIALKKAYNPDNNMFTDYNYLALLVPFILGSVYSIAEIFGDIVSLIVKISTPFYLEKQAQKTFTTVKVNKKLKTSVPYYIIFGTAVFLILLIISISKAKKAEFVLNTDFLYTITNNGSYMIYRLSNGEIYQVFQNYFKFCNGVSGYIAIPIIIFTIAVIACIGVQVIKNNLIKDITNEQIITPQENAEVSQNSQQ